jgi:hypothetical protein
MTSFESVVLALAVAYALIGALLLALLIYARLPWPAKAVAIVVTSCFYLVSFVGARGLLGWSSRDPLPPRFKLLQARIVEPHSLEGEPGAIHLWVEALGDDNRPSGVPAPIACHITPSWRRRPKGPLLPAQTADRRAAGRPISDQGTAVWQRKPYAW